MYQILNPPYSQKNTISTKLVMGLMVAAISVLMGTSSGASAMSGHHNSNWSQSHSQQVGSGYGGNNVNVGVQVGDIIGNNNVIHIVINYFFGS